MLLNDIFNDKELDEIIEKGLKIGLERANDENILNDIDYNIKNGEHSELDDYKKRLYSNSLNQREKSIIEKYRDIDEN